MEDWTGEVKRLLAELQAGRIRLESPKPSRFTLKAAAWELSVSLTTLKRMVRAGVVRVVSDGGRSFVPASEVVRLSEPEPKASRPKAQAHQPRTAAEEADAIRKLR